VLKSPPPIKLLQDYETASMIKASSSNQNSFIKYSRRQFDLVIFSAFFYAFMEWLFFATKPSYLSGLPTFESFKVLLITGCVLALILLAAFLLLSLPGWALKKQNLLSLASVVPTAVIAITCLLMLDNFTYTVFGFGISASSGSIRAGYAIGFAIAAGLIFRSVERSLRSRRKTASFLAPGLLAFSLIFFLPLAVTSLRVAAQNSDSSNPSSKRSPNIIVLGSDGLSARYLSAYGYSLPTTPFLNTLVDTSLVADNAFPNATSTTASTTTMLTGKEAARVRVYRYPNVLNGEDSFQHLPGILKQAGYQTMEVGTPYYVDAHQLNLLNGFDLVYNESLRLAVIDPLRYVLGNSPSMLFIQTIFERAAERLLHILYLRDMQNPILEVNSPGNRTSDEDRIAQILNLVDHADRPVFIFAHLMDTHGPIFAYQHQVFSTGADAAEWDLKHYLDAILTYDDHVKQVYEHLAASGQLDNTILVLYTDHGFRYTIREGIPVVIHFPEDEYSGHIKNNVQIVDIAPTLLDYLGLPAPQWMDGISLLEGEPPATREIFSTAAASPPNLGAPFYQLRLIQVIACQNWYTLSVKDNFFASGSIAGHTSNCDKGLLPSNQDARETIIKYLDANGYDTNSLK